MPTEFLGEGRSQSKTKNLSRIEWRNRGWQVGRFVLKMEGKEALRSCHEDGSRLQTTTGTPTVMARAGPQHTCSRTAGREACLDTCLTLQTPVKGTSLEVTEENTVPDYLWDFGVEKIIEQNPRKKDHKSTKSKETTTEAKIDSGSLT